MRKAHGKDGKDMGIDEISKEKEKSLERTSKDIVEDFKKSQKTDNTINNLKFSMFIFLVSVICSFVAYIIHQVNGESSYTYLLVTLVLAALSSSSLIQLRVKSGKSSIASYILLNVLLGVIALVTIHWEQTPAEVVTITNKHDVKMYSTYEDSIVYDDGSEAELGYDDTYGDAIDHVRVHYGQSEYGEGNYVLQETVYIEKKTFYAYSKAIIKDSYELYINTPNEETQTESSSDTVNGEKIDIIIKEHSVSGNDVPGVDYDVIENE